MNADGAGVLIVDLTAAEEVAHDRRAWLHREVTRERPKRDLGR